MVAFDQIPPLIFEIRFFCLQKRETDSYTQDFCLLIYISHGTIHMENIPLLKHEYKRNKKSLKIQ